jgi:hypothetical protein
VEVKSTLLKSVLNSIPNLQEVVEGFLKRISHTAASENNRNDLFIIPEDFPAVTQCKQVNLIEISMKTHSQ